MTNQDKSNFNKGKISTHQWKLHINFNDPFLHKTYSSFERNLQSWLVSICMCASTCIIGYTHAHTWMLMLWPLSCLYANALSLMPRVVWFYTCLCFHDHMFYLLSLACHTWYIGLYPGYRCKCTSIWASKIAYYPPSRRTIYEGHYSGVGLGCLNSSHPLPKLWT